VQITFVALVSSVHDRLLTGKHQAVARDRRNAIRKLRDFLLVAHNLRLSPVGENGLASYRGKYVCVSSWHAKRRSDARLEIEGRH